MSFHLKIKPNNLEIKKMYEESKFFHVGDVGLDLFITEDVLIEPNKIVAINLQIKTEMIEFTTHGSQSVKHSAPFYIYPRSSVSKLGLMLTNSVGIVDSGYRGNLISSFYNISGKPVYLEVGERLVQIVTRNMTTFTYSIVDELSQTDRGEKGLGSTGK